MISTAANAKRNAIMARSAYQENAKVKRSKSQTAAAHPDASIGVFE